MHHNTPLSYHFKQRHFWFDVGFLLALFVLAYYVPILKILPLLASLELFSFFAFHLFAKSSRFQLQGFLGGFISSTAVFVQTLNDPKFERLQTVHILQTLLFAICAMLLECLLILFFLGSHMPAIYFVPVVTQLLFFLASAFLIGKILPSQESAPSPMPEESDLLIDHPIVWKNVAKLSIIILTLVSIMHFAGNNLGLSASISTFLVSLFEAHAILASIVTQWTMEPDGIELLSLIFVVLAGNTVSKCFLAYKGRNLDKPYWLMAIMIFALVLSGVVTALWQLIWAYL
ncbi:MAG: DUF4010 domain-containing protein [Pseudohongiellaceae bacterium]|nr:DUF4010 domain-containing protein [Pseudohongiellaceae bacterium]